MASAASSVGSAGLLVPVFAPLSAATVAYTAYRLAQLQWLPLLRHFFTGPGRASRILLLLFVITNRKNMPFAWTARVWFSMFRQILAPRGPLPPRALYHYSVTATRAPLLETDYNLHKSNSTYFADLDVSRSHLVMHLFKNGMKAVTQNDKTRVVKDKDGNLVRGGFGIGLGSVFCSFKREIAPYEGYEMWSRVLCHDRKWLYIVTHFVKAGRVRPTSWDGRSWLSGRFKVRSKGADENGKKKAANGSASNGSASSNGAASSGLPPSVTDAEDFQKHIFATAISKYVFKLGRFTVHPAIIMEGSGLLPERPGGWRGGDESDMGAPVDFSGYEEELAAAAAAGPGNGEWDWKRVEWERRKGMEFAQHFAALDSMHAIFDGGSDGALGRFIPG